VSSNRIGSSPSAKSTSASTSCALKVIGANGFGSVSWFIAAIDWAARNGIQVTNNSYGGTTASAVFEQALANAAPEGMVHVASAG
jgi:hypothetical protein